MVLTSAVMWGTTGTARALGAADASPFAVGAVRILIGGALLVAIAVMRGSLRARWPLFPTIAAAAGVALYQLTFFAGVARAGVAVGTIVGIGSAPVFAGLIAAVVLRERPGRRWMAATGLAIVGVALLARPASDAALDALGLLLPLGAGATYALYATATKMLLERHDSVAVAAMAFGGGAILLLPVLATSDLGWLARPSGVIAALELGVVATTLAYLLFTRGLARLPVSWGATLSLAEPLTATVLATLVLHEALAPAQAAGATLVAAGLVALATARTAS